MTITIAERLRPFSHQPGARCVLPRTHWIVEAFPTLIRLYDGSNPGVGRPKEIHLPVHGPVKEFTLQQDLEKGCVYVWGISREGRYRFCLRANEREVECCSEGKDSLSWPLTGPYENESGTRERLSLGQHKSQEWGGVLRRMDLRELLPMLFHLSQWTPSRKNDSECEMLRLLNRGFEDFLRAGFTGILVPTLVDELHQGLVAHDASPGVVSPYALISEGGVRIRNLFISQDGRSISLSIPREFACGRMTDIRLPAIGTLSIEWSKGMMRRAHLRTEREGTVRFLLPKILSSFRCRTSQQEKGKCRENGEEWACEAERDYFLDRFQK